MAAPIIEVERLSKLYRLGATVGHDTLRDAMAGGFRRMLGRGADVPGHEAEDLWALKDVSFGVAEGEVLGVIGRNGAGKSTLLKILSRITDPTSGTAKIRGRVASLLEVGTGFHPELTGRENIFLNGAILGMRKDEIRARFDEIAAFSEVERFLDTPVKRYSSGMYVRLAFAVAAHIEPEILIVDEVLAVGDAAFQKKCLGKMQDVTKGGRTVLFVSHNMGAIRQICSRAVLLDGGTVLKDGPVDDVVARYVRQGSDALAAEYRWDGADAPGDGGARLLGMRLCTRAGETRSEFGTDEDICVELTYEVLAGMPAFRVGCSLHGSDGTYVFYTSDNDSPERSGRYRGRGRYTSRCTVPGRLLNVGEFFFVVSGDVFRERTVFGGLPRLHFMVVSTGGPTSVYGERRAGVLCPALDWDVSFDGAAGRGAS